MIWGRGRTYKPCLDPRRPCEGWTVIPGNGVTGYEIGEGAREENEAAKYAKDVEDGKAVGTFVGDCGVRVSFVGSSGLLCFCGDRIGGSVLVI